MSEEIKEAVVDVTEDAIEAEDVIVVDVESVIEEEEELPTFIELSGKTYSLYKTGGEQAQQVSDLLNWLGKYGEGLAESLVGSSDTPDALSLDVWSMISAIGKVSSKQALMDLFVVVIGCTPAVAEKHFSITALVDGVQILFSQEEYVKVFNRFF